MFDYNNGNKNFEDIGSKCISFYDFFEYLSKKEITLSIPEMQRMFSWGDKKIKNILNESCNEYFGNITLKKEGNEFLIIDGQQRIIIFLMMYISLRTESGFKIIKSHQFDESDTTTFWKIFYKNNEIDEEKASFLEKYNFLNPYIQINNIGQKVIEKKLKESYITISIIDEKFSQYRTFIDLNHKNVKLSDIDILKAFFISNLRNRDQPTEIKKMWRESFDAFYTQNLNISSIKKEINNKSKQTKIVLESYNLDQVISYLMFILSKKDVQKNKIFDWYLKDISKICDQDKNDYVHWHSKIISEFCKLFYNTLNLKNIKEEKSHNKFIKLLIWFSVPTKYNKISYSPQLLWLMSIAEKINESNFKIDNLSKYIEYIIYSNILYIVNQNIDKEYNIRANKFRSNVINFSNSIFLEIYNKKWAENIIKKYECNNVNHSFNLFTEINLNLILSEYEKNFIQLIIKSFQFDDKKIEYLKNNNNILYKCKDQFCEVYYNKLICNPFLVFNRNENIYILLQWYYEKKILNSINLNFSDWFKKFTIEHVIDKKIKDMINKKNDIDLFATYITVLFEQDYHNSGEDAMNTDLNKQNFNKINEYLMIKSNYYIKSKSYVTREILKNFDNQKDIMVSLKDNFKNILFKILGEIFDYCYKKILNYIKIPNRKKLTNEVKYLDCILRFKNMTVDEISKNQNIKLNYKNKGFKDCLISKIIDKNLPLNCKIKNISIKKDDSKSCLIEHINLCRCNFNEFKDNTNYDNSDFKKILDRKIIFIVWTDEKKDSKLLDIREYNFTDNDKLFAKAVWIHTKTVIQTGNVCTKNKNHNEYNFIKSGDNKIFHLRPHDTKSINRHKLQDNCETCNFDFWLNKDKFNNEF